MELTVRQILDAEWTARGRKLPVPVEFIRAWRLENEDPYGSWPLKTRFKSGSSFPEKPRDPFERDDDDPDELATEPPRRREARLRHEEGLRYARAEAAAYQQKRNAEEIAKGNPPPFEEWWNDDE